MSTERIRELNDAFRQTFSGGRLMMTRGIAALSEEMRSAVLERTRVFDAFASGNDPHREHDFGSFDMVGTKFFWKIDYYDAAMEFRSEDPADPAKTTRVLTIMLACEY